MTTDPTVVVSLIEQLLAPVPKTGVLVLGLSLGMVLRRTVARRLVSVLSGGVARVRRN